MGDRIDPEIEAPVRRLLGHALRVETVEFDKVIEELANDEWRYAKANVLAQHISRAVMIDICDGELPNAAALREIADAMAGLDDGYELDPEVVHTFLARVVVGSERINEVMEPEAAVKQPFIIASHLVASNADTEDGLHWWDYLEQIEAALEAAGYGSLTADGPG